MKKRFFTVIHCIDPYEKQGVGHAMCNVKTALDYGASGVFLIGHGIDHNSMGYIYENVRRQNPNAWIGINFLDLATAGDWERMSRFVKKMCYGLNGLWLDNLPAEKLDIDPSIEVFGGVAFKYINPDIKGDELVDACNKAKQVVNVITISGNATGQPAEVSKLDEIRKIIGDDSRLVLASGVSFENIYDFLPVVDDFFVASSMTERKKDLGNQEYLVPKKVYELFVAISKGLPIESVCQITENRFKPASKS